MFKGVFNINNRQLKFMMMCSKLRWPQIINFAIDDQ